MHYHKGVKIPTYPDFAPIDIRMREELYPALNMLTEGISEFTFSGLYLFRDSYQYRISRIPRATFVISGQKAGKTFFYTPCCVPECAKVGELLESHDYYRHLSDLQIQEHRIRLECNSLSIFEDRDQFDYLYERKDLAELSGKHYHKKRNLVNAFLASYSYEQKPLDRSTLPDALAVLDAWRERRGEGDYKAAREGLELYSILELRGAVYYVDGKAAAYCLGESLAKGRMFAVHFEKAVDDYKGIYQFINQAFAQALPSHFKLINREQDLGDEGLRQAKMTYRPSGFVRKYKALKKAASQAAIAEGALPVNRCLQGDLCHQELEPAS
jgi:hypothetical protein